MSEDKNQYNADFVTAKTDKNGVTAVGYFLDEDGEKTYLQIANDEGRTQLIGVRLNDQGKPDVQWKDNFGAVGKIVVNAGAGDGTTAPYDVRDADGLLMVSDPEAAAAAIKLGQKLLKDGKLEHAEAIELKQTLNAISNSPNKAIVDR